MFSSLVLTEDRRNQLASSGLFTSPDRLVQYLWADSRGHPIQGFTGTKTIEATFTNDYYSGQFLKGYHHGRGKHISSTGMIYEGDFVFGRRHGQGKLIYPTGDSRMANATARALATGRWPTQSWICAKSVTLKKWMQSLPSVVTFVPA